MAIWFSDSAKPLPIHLLGKGDFPVWEEGASLFSIRAGYFAPHIFSIVPDFGGAYHEMETVELSDGNGMMHRLFYSSAVIEMSARTLCDLQITDLLPEGESVFIRRFDGITALNWRMSIPSYVRTVFHPAYRFHRQRADTLFLTVPAGTPFENGMATVRQQTAAVIFCGSLRYDSVDQTLYYGGDLGELYFLLYDDPQELIRRADQLLAAFARYGEAPALHPIYGESFREGSPSKEGQPPFLPLWTMQSREGAVVASQREPYAIAADLPALTQLFLRENRPDAALKMLLCWTKAQEEQGFVPARLLCGTGAVCESGQPDYSAIAAYLLAAIRLFRGCNLEGKDATVLFRGMRSAFSALMKGFREGMLPFSTRTAAFDAGILGRELLFQGSAEVTALGVRAGEEFFAFCRDNGKRAAKEEQGYRTILAEAATIFEKNFAPKGRICRNAPRLETLSRRPRFIRGVCTLCQRDGAYPFEDTLELDKYGRYLCRRCFASRRGTPEETDPAMRYSAPHATVLAALLMNSPAALVELPAVAMTYAKRRYDSKASLPLREADTDPLLLLALRSERKALIAHLRENEAELALLTANATALGMDPSVQDADALLDFLTDGVRAILHEEAEEGTLSALLCDTVPLGARHTAGATALYHLAIT